MERIFRIRERRSTVSTELVGGITHFMGSVFNLVATASVLKVGGLPFIEGVAGGAWATFVSQILTGLFSNLPISVVAGAGPNLTMAYLLAQAATKGGLGSYQAAVTCCMISGLVIVLLTSLGVISAITNLVPISLKLGIGVGIGLLCAFVGFQQVDMVVRSDEGLVGPGDFVNNPEIWLSLGGLLLLTLLNARRVPGAIVLTMLVLTVVDWSCWTGWPAMELDPLRLPTLYWPDLRVLGSLTFWTQVSAMVLMLVFDAMGCIFGLAKLAGLLDAGSGQVEGGDGIFHAIGLGTTAAAVFGISPMVVAGASAAAIAEGSRTGLSTCVSGLLFLATLPLSSILAAMPPCTTSFVLIFVGASMFAEAAHIAWDDPIAAVPAFLCIICQPFLFSIADGIYVGLAASCILSVLSGRAFSHATPGVGVEHDYVLTPGSSVQLPIDGFAHTGLLPYSGLPRKESGGDIMERPLLSPSPSSPFMQTSWSA